MEEFFERLEDEGYFCGLVKKFYETVPAEMAAIFECEIDVDEEKLKYAHGEYVQAVRELALYLDSKDPDHYKRSGALLHALHKGMIVAEVRYGTAWEEIEAGGGPLGLHYNDVSNGLEFKAFFDKFFNEMLAFMLAFKCCDAYEEAKHTYTFNYLHNVCAYLHRNQSDVGLETCYMLFKSLMH